MARVLIVDDAEFMRTKAKATLEAAGYQVIEAADGEEAVTAFADEKPDLVLMDLTMPKIDGLEAIRRIRRATPDAKVIVVSVVSQLTQVQDARHAGAVDFVVKPYTAERLLQAVRRFAV